MPRNSEIKISGLRLYHTLGRGKAPSPPFGGMGDRIASTFVELSDTPADYAGQADKFVRVAGDESALVFGTIADGEIATEMIADGAVTEDHISSGAIGVGLIGGSGTPIAVSPDGVTIENDVNGEVGAIGKGIVKYPCRVATTAALPSYTASGGTLTASANGALGAIDGVTLSVSNRILIKNETGANEKYNGSYFVGSLGDGSSPWVLTRTADADASSSVFPGIIVPVTAGTINGDKLFHLTTDGTITLGTTALQFEEYAPGGSGSAEIIVRCVITKDFSGVSEVPNGIPTSGEADGVTLSGGEKVLVFSETDTTLNGFYIVAAGTWSRSSDTIVAGVQVQVMAGGTIAGGHIFHCANTTNPTVGVSAITFTRSKALPPNNSVTTAAVVDGAITSSKIANNSLDLKHLSGTGSAPAIAAGPAAGTGPTVSIVGTDLAGVITVATGTSTILDDVLATITFNSAFGVAPRSIVLFQGNNDAAIRISQIYIDPTEITSTLFKIRVGLAGALSASTTYKYHYIIIG